MKSKAVFTSLLENNGLRDIEITKWWRFFDRVLARKNGESQPVRAKKLSDAMRCPQCGQIEWKKEASALVCQNCKKELSITKEGIVLN